MSSQAPSKPNSKNRRAYPAHQRRVSGRLKSGNTANPGQTRPVKTPAAEFRQKTPAALPLS